MKSKVLLYTALFFLLSIILNQISQLFEKEKLKNITYGKSEINDFTLVGINGDRYVLNGDKIIEDKNRYIIYGFDLKYNNNQEKFKIIADKGIYLKNKDILDLIGNVRIHSAGMDLETQILRVLVKERRAFNSDPVLLKSKGMITKGRNIFINLKEEMLKLEDVKTVYRGS